MNKFERAIAWFIGAPIWVLFALFCGFMIGQMRVQLYAIKAGAATYDSKHNTVVFMRNHDEDLLGRLDKAMHEITVTNIAIETFVGQVEKAKEAMGQMPLEIDTIEKVNLLNQYVDLEASIEAIKKTLGMPFTIQLILRSITPAE